MAELAEPSSPPDERQAAVSCAVIAGIAASDAACSPGGPDAARKLERLLNLKDQAQYGLQDVSGQKFASSLRQAQGLVAFAREVLQR